MRRHAIMIAASVAACSFEHRGLFDANEIAGPDADPSTPDASVDATVTIDASPLDPDATPCENECVDANSIFDCTSGMIRSCTVGCVSTGAGDRCGIQVVSNDPVSASHLAGVPDTADLVVEAVPDDPIMGFYSHWEIFTDTGQIFDANTSTEVRGPGTGIDGATGIAYYDDLPGIGVFVFDTLTIDDGARLWVYGSRALLILSRRDVLVKGVIDVTAGISPDGTTAALNYPGPGGFGGGVGATPAQGCAPGENGFNGTMDETGGGGGALAVGHLGGDGGDSGNLGGDGGDPDAALCPSARVVPLQGGSGGGSGGAGGVGGGGGGAVQITSLSSITFQQESVGADVGVWAAGQGGAGGGGGSGGGGGGSGGAILIEAPTVTLGVSTFLAANGGGGGAGGTSGLTANGSLGGKGLTAAPGGVGARSGGIGGAGGSSPAQGTGGGDGTGGGGGAVGIVAINANGGATPGLISPSATLGPVPAE